MYFGFFGVALAIETAGFSIGFFVSTLRAIGTDADVLLPSVDLFSVAGLTLGATGDEAPGTLGSSVVDLVAFDLVFIDLDGIGNATGWADLNSLFVLDGVVCGSSKK